ncbi:acyltransferase [Flavobacterium sp. SUN052]|uniref:acyltransferase n=1 Tax=Flavobacterium sp. SUN052 TaxID=3002441 RepID=UPI00237ECDFF|nr:acyltransferase [Flavobacterium sp. SUN052]MEC4003527.1 acyltransferase [Flavobacterium sp. SUN052]
MSKLRKILKVLNLKTIYFNFKYLPFKSAIKLPFLISSNVYLKKTNGKIIIEGPIFFGMIKIGLGDIGIFDERVSRSIWNVSGKVNFKGTANIGHGSKISVDENGCLELGNNFQITAETAIVSHCKIVFGNDCLLSWDILIMDTDFHKIVNDKGEIINESKPILIESNVWIGCRCTILKGSIIPKNAIIGANSLITNSLEKQNALYVGNPIKCIKENINWEL